MAAVTEAPPPGGAALGRSVAVIADGARSGPGPRRVAAVGTAVARAAVGC